MHAGFCHQLPEVVCWSRIQAEAGQQLKQIVKRKEVERRAGGGTFFWGVGNAPSRALAFYVSCGREVDVVFSTMKTAPKAHDEAPAELLVWRSYFDALGTERQLPEHALVTSRAMSGKGRKKVHYALVCWSDEQLRLDDFGPFDHRAYLNAGTGGKIGASQVTALLQQSRPPSEAGSYRVNLRAKLRGASWVKLGDPLLLSASKRKLLRQSEDMRLGVRSWIELVSKLRKGRSRKCVDDAQYCLF